MKKFIVVEVDGKVRQHIAKNNRPDKYSEPKIFDTALDAQRWIDRHYNKYIPIHYEISEWSD